MGNHTPPPLSDLAPVAQQQFPLVQILGMAQPPLCGHIVDAATPNTWIRPRSHIPTHTTTSCLVLHDIWTLATEFVIVVCLAYVLVSAVIILTGPPSTTSIDFIRMIGPLCLVTSIAFAALGLIRAAAWLVDRVYKTREGQRGFIEEAREGVIDKIAEDVEAGGGDIRCKTHGAGPDQLSVDNPTH